MAVLGPRWSPPTAFALMEVSEGLAGGVLGVDPFGLTGYSCTRLIQTELLRTVVQTFLHYLKN